MQKEIIISAHSVEQACREGAAMLGVDADSVSYEVIEEAKKGFFGVGNTPAKIKIFVESAPKDAAAAFVEMVAEDLELDVQMEETTDAEGNTVIQVWGGNAGILIGHHGDTLDALQYLANLAAVHAGEKPEKRVFVDVEHYRERRERTLRQLARRMANKVLKSGHSVVLEPMNPYERRIIHAEVQGVAGVMTSSVGEDDNRRVVIYLEDGPLPQILVEDPSQTSGSRSVSSAKRPRRRRPSNKPTVRHTENAICPDPEGEEYYMDAPTTYVHAPTPRPEKLKSLASYFGEEDTDDDVTDETQDIPEEHAEGASDAFAFSGEMDVSAADREYSEDDI